jgi:uncharacterized protein YbaR (Trm112 family)
MTELAERLACPRCDKTPLQQCNDTLLCKACKVEFPFVSEIPWLFADPEAALGEWRGRLRFALQQLDHETAGIDQELKANDLPALTRQRVQRYRGAVAQHRQSIEALLEPLQLQSLQGNYETYLALRTRLPVDQGLNTYYANVHRDWAWGAKENDASVAQIRAVLGNVEELGDVLVLGCGAGRLAYDLHMQLNCKTLTAMDFNPLLMLVAETVTKGDQLDLFEFPIAPLCLEDDAVLRTLTAPEAVRDGFQLILGDVLRAPFPAQSFDTVVTPWLIDILTEDLSVFAKRVNHLLTDKGRWINFGSHTFTAPQRSQRYSVEETFAIAVDSGFAQPVVSEATIPYMCSPASRHGRQETVLTFCAIRERGVKCPARHRALPDWIVTGKEPVPLMTSFRSQAMTTRIYAFIMSLIDGRRSLKDMAEVMEQQQLMTTEEAEPAIRSFLTKMYDDAQRQSGF